MHLKQLKLAGFKSFVDPTTVHVPSQLVAVVGPNGCGKSNIIDAVRWVMGESSAKNLRGESMVDVIFNGSSQRKSVGQASVELVFDNSLGRLTGAFASYGEISVKRVVTRDGESAYYLNGSKCRRKDITDIFLGTGAGARGYSIIGQGTISRMIEARPEELRLFLEEAAGVSKYKDRRRETLLRIEHTRDNVTRLTDIREELGKQLQRLERQAKAAERYSLLKEEEHRCRAEILALKWKDYAEQQAVKQKELQTLAIRYEQQQSMVTDAHKSRVQINEQLFAANEHTQQVQEAFYALGTEIARLEARMQQQAHEKKRLEQERQQIQEDWQRAAQQVHYDTEALTRAQKNAEDANVRVHHLVLALDEKKQQGQELNKANEESNTRWQELQTASNTISNEYKITQMNRQHVEERLKQHQVRLEQLNTDQDANQLIALQREQEKVLEQHQQAQAAYAEDAERLRCSHDTLNAQRQQLQELEHSIRRIQDAFDATNSEYAALLAAQKAVRAEKKPKHETHEDWGTQATLMEVLQVQPQWQMLCELLLDDALHAYILEVNDPLWSKIRANPCQGIDVVTMKKASDTKSNHPRLSDHIIGLNPVTSINLEHIYTVHTLDEAMSLLPQLEAFESILTPEGYWLGTGWAKWLSQEGQEQSGLLERQKNIDALALVVQEQRAQLDDLKEMRDAHHDALHQATTAWECAQKKAHASNEALTSMSAAVRLNEQALVHAQQRQQERVTETASLQLLIADLSTEQAHLKEQFLILEGKMEEFAQLQEQGYREKQERANLVAAYNKELEDMRFSVHQAELAFDREQAKVRQLSEQITREQERLDTLAERLEHVTIHCMECEEPSAELKDQTAQKLAQQATLEAQVALSREQAAHLKQALDLLEKTLEQHEREAVHVQEAIGATRAQEQALAVRVLSTQEALDSYHALAQEVLAHIPEHVTQQMREEELIALTDKIKRLGAINLAAIEEYATEQERKRYLDEQYEDLNQALLTLETAIDKMDQETRQRLEDTFDAVNTSFQTLFPRLFGGGRAHIERTCDNLLEAGIVVMAQPPGKRNSTIHLLSGGEKAMTAVALVFAFFQLNPSPFCMLDEVDAPLDDVNVGRFCSLVKEMSQFVQFLFITHNKVTMELAEHLIGVTMREPGVSRLVAVDVKHTLAME